VNLYYGTLATDRSRINAAEHCHSLPCGTVVIMQEPTRSLEQNAKMWPMLQEIAEQVEWSVDGKMQFIPKEDWKVILTAGLRKAQRVAAGIDGGFCLLGESTSKMSVKEMAELITFIEWFGAEHDVKFNEGDSNERSTA
jgi:hypothetical protein